MTERDKRTSLLWYQINDSLNKFLNTTVVIYYEPLPENISLEFTEEDKHAGLRQYGINYDRNQLYSTGPPQSLLLLR